MTIGPTVNTCMDSYGIIGVVLFMTKLLLQALMLSKIVEMIITLRCSFVEQALLLIIYSTILFLCYKNILHCGCGLNAQAVQDKVK